MSNIAQYLNTYSDLLEEFGCKLHSCMIEYDSNHYPYRYEYKFHIVLYNDQHCLLQIIKLGHFDSVTYKVDQYGDIHVHAMIVGAENFFILMMMEQIEALEKHKYEVYSKQFDRDLEELLAQQV